MDVAVTDEQREAVATLTRCLRRLPPAALRRMAGSATPTVATVAQAILAARPDDEPLHHAIFPS